MTPYQPERHGPTRVVGPGFHERVFAVVRRVPRGRVTTYGDVGKAMGLTTIARHVGYALAALTAEHGDVPWHRVQAASATWLSILH
jgi:methylated-DNA-protein-cysteine methyltransferase-like protein